MNALITYAHSNRLRFLAELCDFLRFPSISAQPRHAGDVRRCAEWLATHLRGVGLEHVQVIETPRHPLVCAEWRRAPRRPTLLIYGHYDVQPVDPLGEWRTPPFAPSVRGDYLYGRGASDDKGQLFCHLKAIEAYLRTSGRLPVNVVCLFEGEEEIGSPNLAPFVRRNRRALAAAAAVISDTSIPAPDRPAITYGLRGSLGLELELRGPRQDLHSGHFGGAIHNPAQALCEVLAALHDASGRVAIPGFYDRVRPVSLAERAALARAAPSDGQILRNAGVERGWGERAYTLYERATIRPALTINGITAGYQGPGGKGIIPARAAAKISFRLVPDQDPSEIEQLFRAHIARVTPPTVRAAVRVYSAARPALVSRRHPAVRAAAVAYRRGFDAAPAFLRSGGTIPVVNTFQEILGIPTALMGFGLPGDRIHAPNEKLYLPNFDNGIATAIWFLHELGASDSSQERRHAPALAGVRR
jgi:acetylornithine deacetylase/succinyl-diaminopimelate desuccinylase-like protein